MREPYVVRVPATSIRSLTTSRFPCSGPARVQPFEDPSVANASQLRSFAPPLPPSHGRPAATRPAPSTGARVIKAVRGQPSTDHRPPRWLGEGLALASLAYSLWLQARPQPPAVEVVPWVMPDGAGVTVGGRF